MQMFASFIFALTAVLPLSRLHACVGASRARSFFAPNLRPSSGYALPRIILSLFLALQLSLAGAVPSHAHASGEISQESWAEVVSVEIEQKALKAYNLTVADFHTYFVRGAANDNAQAVWVHNACDIRWGPNAQSKLRKHANDIYGTARANGVQIDKGDWDAVKKYINDVTISGNRRNSEPFKWNTETVNGYVQGKSIVLTKENGEFLTFLHSDRLSSYLKQNLNL